MKTIILTIAIMLFIAFSGLEAKPKKLSSLKVKPDPELISFIKSLFKDVKDQNCQNYKNKIYKYYIDNGSELIDLSKIDPCADNSINIYYGDFVNYQKINTYIFTRENVKELKDNDYFIKTIQDLFNFKELSEINELILVDFCPNHNECWNFSIFVKYGNSYKIIRSDMAG